MKCIVFKGLTVLLIVSFTFSPAYAAEFDPGKKPMLPEGKSPEQVQVLEENSRAMIDQKNETAEVKSGPMFLGPPERDPGSATVDFNKDESATIIKGTWKYTVGVDGSILKEFNCTPGSPCPANIVQPQPVKPTDPGYAELAQGVINVLNEAALNEKSLTKHDRILELANKLKNLIPVTIVGDPKPPSPVDLKLAPAPTNNIPLVHRREPVKTEHWTTGSKGERLVRYTDEDNTDF